MGCTFLSGVLALIPELMSIVGSCQLVCWNLSPFCSSLSPGLHICTNLDAHLQTVDFNSDVLMKKKKIAREMSESFLNQ